MKQLFQNAFKQKNLLTFCIFTFLLAISNGSYAGSSSDPGINIGIIGDQTGSYDLAQSYSILQHGVQVLSQQNIDVVIHVGDMLESTASETEVRSQFAQATAIMDQLPVSWYMTEGDHDVNPPVYQQDSSDRSREALFQQLYGARVPQVLQHLYYSFDVGDYHFVAIDSQEALHADPRWGNIFLAQVSDQQYAWLASDLDAHKNAKAIIVFLHQPLWYNWSAWKRVHNLLRHYPVAAVVAGHFHYDQTEGSIDGIRYFVVGATGGMVKQGDRDAGDMQHVSVMHVKGPRQVKFNLISLTDNLPLHFTPRVDMDKIQSMDIVLGELWNFASTNPVYVKNGALVNDCASNDPAVINITPIGNPTDKTMTVDIGFSSTDPNVQIASAGFAPGQCASVTNDYECQMARSARIFLSNFSSVSVNPYAGPLWTATLAAGNTAPQAGAALNFNIRLTYPGKSGDLYLDRTATTTISSCP